MHVLERTRYGPFREFGDTEASQFTIEASLFVIETELLAGAARQGPAGQNRHEHTDNGPRHDCV